MLAHHPPPPPYRAGTILGWAPSDDSHDYAYTTTATTSSYPPPPPYEGPSLAYVSDPGSAQSYIPRSLSLDSAVRPRSEPDAHDTSSSYTVYDNPTSMRRYKIKRSQDPTWAPRPPNAFILFRRDYVNRHKGENIVAETKQQQKTLSKRASDAWKSAEDDEKQVWYEKAKLEALKHAAAHPDYVFRPKKRRIEARRHPAMLSRREQVEEFVRKSTRRRAVATRPRAPVHLESHTPGSARSSASPEPPCTPSSEESNPLSNDVPTGLQSRSDSLPARFDYPDYFPPMQNRSYMSQAAMLSMPSLVSERPLALKRSFSHSDMQPYSPWDYVNLGDDYSESDDQSIFSFDSVGGEPSPAAYGGEHSDQPSPVNFELSLHTPEGHFMPEPQHISTPLEMPEPLVMPSVDPATMMLPSTSVAPPPSSPLFERRRRAATISTLPSPLTVITSSLSGWARDDLVTARMAPRANPSPPAPPVLPLQFDTYQPMPESDEWAQNYVTPMMLQVPAMLGTDMDNTPRVPDFPQNVMGTGPPVHDHPVEYSAPEPQPQPQHIMPFTDPFDLSADLDLEAYNIGLHHYNVAAGAGPGFAEASRYGMPPSSYDVDYSTIFHGGGGTQE